MSWLARALGGLMLVAGLSHCRRPCVPDLEIYESPAEALFSLAADFRDRGDRVSERLTLERIVGHYPSSRFAVMAREALSQIPPAAHSASAPR